MHRVAHEVLVAVAIAGTLGLLPLGCWRNTVPTAAPEKSRPSLDVGRGDDDQPSRGICERLEGDDDVPALGAWQVPLTILPAPDAPEWQVRRLEAFVKAHLAGWERGPGKAMPPLAACSAYGPPICHYAYRGVDFCTDACGRRFWSLSDEETCVGAQSGRVYHCDGFAH